MMAHIATAFQLLLTPQCLGVIVLASFYGLFIGSMPGLTASMAAALMIPFTIFMDPIPALAAIVTMEAMAIFAGDIPAALLRMPGTPASAAYVDDSYALAKQGKVGLVLGVDLICSVIGGIFGTIILVVGAPLLAEFAMKFTSFEYFWLALLGLSSAVVISSDSPVKGTISLLFGLLLAVVGLDITMGYQRFTFSNMNLASGINFIPVMIGLFGVSEILRNVFGKEMKLVIAELPKKIFTGVGGVIKHYKFSILRSGIIGTIIGFLPGAGGDIGAWISYGVAKSTSPDKEQFGKGHIEPISCATTANNAALGGTWIPALVFGIPGDSITAILIGVLMMKGLKPGPMIFQNQPDLIYAVFITFFLANLLLIPFGYLVIRASSQVLRISKNILLPIILLFCLVGSFAVNNSLFDVGITIIMGILGYYMEAYGFPVAPTILALVLGPLLEQNFMSSMFKANWNCLSFFNRPFSAILALLILLLWLYPILRRLVKLFGIKVVPKTVG
jgi:putative tricarboxylic transport membrane protein